MGIIRNFKYFLQIFMISSFHTPDDKILNDSVQYETVGSF